MKSFRDKSKLILRDKLTDIRNIAIDVGDGCDEIVKLCNDAISELLGYWSLEEPFEVSMLPQLIKNHKKHGLNIEVVNKYEYEVLVKKGFHLIVESTEKDFGVISEDDVISKYIELFYCDRKFTIGEVLDEIEQFKARHSVGNYTNRNTHKVLDYGWASGLKVWIDIDNEGAYKDLVLEGKEIFNEGYSVVFDKLRPEHKREFKANFENEYGISVDYYINKLEENDVYKKT